MEVNSTNITTQVFDLICSVSIDAVINITVLLAAHDRHVYKRPKPTPIQKDPQWNESESRKHLRLYEQNNVVHRNHFSSDEFNQRLYW